MTLRIQEDNDMRFLGTAAADCIPSPLCDCPICQDARQRPERMRLRSMFQIDEETLIDCGPDFAAACMRWQVSMGPLKQILITHTHEDHFCESNAGLIHMSITRRTVPVDVYLSESAYLSTRMRMERLGTPFRGRDAIKSIADGLARLHVVKTFEPFAVGAYRAMAVRTTHRASESETAVNYLITRPNGRKLLYACDTGLYPPDTLEALKNAAVDTLVMEATFGSRLNNDSSSHLNAATFVQMLEMLAACGAIRPDTAVYATHINDKHDLNHEAYQAWFDRNAPQRVIVAADGMFVE